MLVDPGTGELKVRSFVGDEVQMGGVFQDFAFRFWKRHTDWRVKREEPLAWYLEPIDGCALPPEMRMDVVLRSASKTIVVECKFTDPLSEGRFTSSRNLKSAHLYQLNAYLTNLEVSDSDADRCADAILLYPQVGEPVHREYLMRGHRVRVMTVDLSRDWTEIHSQFLALPGHPEGQNFVESELQRLA
jgi:5-methylcytosine-specific restriction enzyme subunit McrC